MKILSYTIFITKFFIMILVLFVNNTLKEESFWLAIVLLLKTDSFIYIIR